MCLLDKNCHFGYILNSGIKKLYLRTRLLIVIIFYYADSDKLCLCVTFMNAECPQGYLYESKTKKLVNHCQRVMSFRAFALMMETDQVSETMSVNKPLVACLLTLTFKLGITYSMKMVFSKPKHFGAICVKFI